MLISKLSHVKSILRSNADTEKYVASFQEMMKY